MRPAKLIGSTSLSRRKKIRIVYSTLPMPQHAPYHFMPATVVSDGDFKALLELAILFAENWSVEIVPASEEIRFDRNNQSSWIALVGGPMHNTSTQEFLRREPRLLQLPTKSTYLERQLHVPFAKRQPFSLPKPGVYDYGAIVQRKMRTGWNVLLFGGIGPSGTHGAARYYAETGLLQRCLEHRDFVAVVKVPSENVAELDCVLDQPIPLRMKRGENKGGKGE